MRRGPLPMLMSPRALPTWRVEEVGWRQQRLASESPFLRAPSAHLISTQEGGRFPWGAPQLYLLSWCSGFQLLVPAQPPLGPAAVPVGRRHGPKHGRQWDSRASYSWDNMAGTGTGPCPLLKMGPSTSTASCACLFVHESSQAPASWVASPLPLRSPEARTGIVYFALYTGLPSAGACWVQVGTVESPLLVSGVRSSQARTPPPLPSSAIK